MNERNMTGWGLILGTAVGGGIGILLMIFTGQAFFIAVAGIGAIIGLLFGAGIGKDPKSR